VVERLATGPPRRSCTGFAAAEEEAYQAMCRTIEQAEPSLAVDVPPAEHP
jgi:hypothetical protein